MIGALLNGFFQLLITIIGSLLQLLLWPLNAGLTAIFPDFSQSLIDIAQGFQYAIQAATWALDIIPYPLRLTLVFIFSATLTLTTWKISNKALVKMWNLMQKIKFW